ncbi:MAG: hypothetical protein ACRDDX_10875 [Cellulosilyticaceae bacterium]
MVNYGKLQQVMTNTLLNQKAALTDDTKAAFLKCKELFLQGLTVGDLLEGTLVKMPEGNLMLQLKEGIQLPVQLLDALPLHEALQFVVEAVKGDQVYIKPSQPEATMAEKAIQTFGLPETTEMKQCVDTFVEKGMALDKSSLLKTYYLHKQMQLPIEVVVNLVEHLGDEVKNVWGNFKQLPQTYLKEAVQQFGELMAMPPQEVHKEAWAKQQLQLIKVLGGQLPASESDAILSQCFKEGAPEVQFLKEWLTPLEHTSKHQMLEMPEVADGLLQKYINDGQPFQLLLKQLHESAFTLSAEKLQTFKKCELPIKQTPLFESYECLQKCLEQVEEKCLTKEGRELLRTIQEPMTQYSKIQDHGQYYTCLFQAQEQRKQAELYFFKPHKKVNGNKKDYLAVIALDLPALHQLEVHIHQQDQEISVTFYVGDEDKQKFLAGHLMEVQARLDTLHKRKIYISCQIKKEAAIKKSTIDQSFTGLDVKV